MTATAPRRHERLPTDARLDFERIVGAANLSDSPALLSGYAWNTGVGKIPGANKFADFWPIAVIMPATVDEVAAVVRCCIRHGLKYKAHSTGYGSMSHVAARGTLAIDLRRMTQMRIDPGNRMAIIDPYVTAGMLQAEALKHGLTCHIVGAGPAHSPLASATSLIGVGITSQGTSANMRNLLSWEWVTPQGDIVRGGSAGIDCGWFSGDGPGPGVRGLIRGFFGAGGGLGVFTRIGIKLYPLPLQQPLQVSGTVPQLGLQIPDNFGFHHAVWPDWNRHRDASFELVDANICFAMLRMPPDHIGWTVTGSNAAYVDLVDRDALPEVARADCDKNWSIVINARSPAELAWREAVLRDIVARTGGRLLDVEKHHRDVLFGNLMTSKLVPRVMRPSGGITTSFGLLDSFHFLPRAMQAAEVSLDGENQPDGRLIEGGREEHWTWPHEGRYVWSEAIINFNPANKSARLAAANALFGHFHECWKQPAGILALGLGPIMDLQGDTIGAPQHYIRQIKKQLDPINASQSKDYIIVDMPPLLKNLLPKLKPLLTSKPVLSLMARAVAAKGL